MNYNPEIPKNHRTSFKKLVISQLISLIPTKDVRRLQLFVKDPIFLLN